MPTIKLSQKGALVLNVVALFCPVDAFCQAFGGPFIHRPLTTGRRHRGRAGPLCWSEPRTRLLGFCQSQYRPCQACYPHPVCRPRSGVFLGSSAMDAWSSSCLRCLFHYAPIYVNAKGPGLHGHFVYRLAAVGDMAIPRLGPDRRRSRLSFLQAGQPTQSALGPSVAYQAARPT